MTDLGMTRLGRGIAVYGIACAVGTLAVHVALGLWHEGIDDYSVTTAAMCIAMSSVVLVAHPNNLRNRSLHVAMAGIVFSATELGGQVVGLPIIAAHLGEAVSPLTDGTIAPSDLPTIAAWALWLTAWTWLPGMFLMLVMVFVRFPDGRLVTRRWRAVEVVLGAGIVGATLPQAITWWPTSDVAYSTNTFDSGLAPLNNLGWALILLGVVGTVGSMVARYRRADVDVRHQLRWIATPFVATCLFVPSYLLIDPDAAAVVTLPLMPLFMVGYGMAITRHRLYDVDIVINRAVVFGALAAFITAIYVAVVVGLGTLLGDTSNLGLSIAATAVVALAFEPIRERVQHAANVLVYGERATPYEVLAGMTGGRSVDAGDLVRQAAALLGEGTGADDVVVWRREEHALRAAWCWPGELPTSPTPQPVDQARTRFDRDLARLLTRDGEIVGAVELHKPRSEPTRPTDIRLLEEFAGQAAVLVANASLTAELQARLDELSASRRRLVAAQDDARRRLERDIHDGAQQNLVALKVKLALARTMAQREDADRVADLVQELSAEADDAVSSLRALARGVYPPLLEAEGLVAALTAQARRAALPVEVRAAGVGRHPRDVEIAVYYCVLEALQNTAKYAQASRATVELADSADGLAFTVHDDGLGFDAAAERSGSGIDGMRDRLDVLHGRLEVRSGRGEGTTVRGTVPSQARRAQASTSSSGVNSDLDTNPTAPASTAPVS